MVVVLPLRQEKVGHVVRQVAAQDRQGSRVTAGTGSPVALLRPARLRELINRHAGARLCASCGRRGVAPGKECCSILEPTACTRTCQPGRSLPPTPPPVLPAPAPGSHAGGKPPLGPFLQPALTLLSACQTSTRTRSFLPFRALLHDWGHTHTHTHQAVAVC